jgi:hypothetical protein
MRRLVFLPSISTMLEVSSLPLPRADVGISNTAFEFAMRLEDGPQTRVDECTAIVGHWLGKWFGCIELPWSQPLAVVAQGDDTEHLERRPEEAPPIAFAEQHPFLPSIYEQEFAHE